MINKISHEVLVQVVKSTSESVAITDNSGKVFWVNDRFIQLTGFQLEDVLGKRPNEVLSGPLTEQKDVEKLHQAVENQIDVKLEILYYKKDTSTFWASVHKSPVLDEKGNCLAYVALFYEITLRKNLETESEIRKKELEKLIDYFPNGSVTLVDAQEKVLYTGGLGYLNSGFNPNELIGKKLIDFIIPEVYHQYLQQKQTLIAGESSVLEVKVNEFVFLNRYEPILNEQNELEHIIIVATDITQDRKNESEISKLGRIVENSLNEIYIFKAENLKFIQLNQTARNNIGYSMEELKEMTPLDIKPLYNKGKFYELIKPLLLKEKEIIVFETVHLRKNGTLYDVEVHLQVLEDGGQKLFVAVILDITDRKKAYLDNILLSKKLQLAYDAAKIGVWEHNLSTNLIKWDLNMYKLYEMEQSSEFITDEEWNSRIHPHDLGLAVNEFNQSIDSFRNHVNAEFRILTASNKIKYIRSSAYIEKDEKGNPKYIFGLNVDITDLKESELKANEANKAKSSFLAKMSHELRTPLNGIIGFSELLKESSTEKNQHLYLSKLNVSAIALLDIVNDILDISKIESGHFDLDCTKTNLLELIDLAIIQVAFMAQAKHLKLEVQLDHDLPTFVKVDPVRFRQVIVNLLGNAIKFTEKGTVKLKVCTTNSSITNHKNRIKFSISDTGIGIAPENLNKIFDEFTQEHEGTSRMFGGTGLGLHISEQIIQKMHSTIEVESDLGKGSTFSFELDFESNWDEMVTLHLEPQRNKIIVVEPNQEEANWLSLQLEKMGIEAIIWENADNQQNTINPSEIIGCIFSIHIPISMFLQTYPPNELLRQGLRQTNVFVLSNEVISDKLTMELMEAGIKNTFYKEIPTFKLNQLLQTWTSKNVETEQQEKNKIDFGFKKILIAEDQEINLFLLNLMLEEFSPNAEIHVAKNGIEVVELFTKEHPDLILMDIQMPLMDGVEATKIIRELDKDVTIIAITAGVFKEDVDYFKEIGITDYLVKPLQKQHLYEMFVKLKKDS